MICCQQSKVENCKILSIHYVKGIYLALHFLFLPKYQCGGGGNQNWNCSEWRVGVWSIPNVPQSQWQYHCTTKGAISPGRKISIHLTQGFAYFLEEDHIIPLIMCQGLKKEKKKKKWETREGEKAREDGSSGCTLDLISKIFLNFPLFKMFLPWFSPWTYQNGWHMFEETHWQLSRSVNVFAYLYHHRIQSMTWWHHCIGAGSRHQDQAASEPNLESGATNKDMEL